MEKCMGVPELENWSCKRSRWENEENKKVSWETMPGRFNEEKEVVCSCHIES